MGYIYKITNKINLKIYIGQISNSIQTRFSQHIYDSNHSNCSGYNYLLHKAIRKYGKDNFILEEIEKVDDNFLQEREIYWIKHFNCCIPNGYNMTQGGEGCPIYNRNEICQKWDNGLSTKEIKKQYGMCDTTLKNILKNYSAYSKEEDLHRQGLIKRVYQYNSNGTLITIHNSINEAAESVHVDRSIISRCCSGEKKSSKGFIWSFSPITFTNKKIKNYKLRKVIKMDMNNNILEVYDNLSVAGRAMNKKNTSYIKECCLGQRDSMSGFKWKFYEE